MNKQKNRWLGDIFVLYMLLYKENLIWKFFFFFFEFFNYLCKIQFLLGLFNLVLIISSPLQSPRLYLVSLYFTCRYLLLDVVFFFNWSKFWLKMKVVYFIFWINFKNIHTTWSYISNKQSEVLKFIESIKYFLYNV